MQMTKCLMLLGGLLGFLIGIAFAVAQQSAWPAALWHAAVAAYAAGFLMRWWGRLWLRTLEQAHREKFAAARSRSQTASIPNKPKL